MKKLQLLFLCMVLISVAHAQETVSGVVVNSYDSSKIPFAKISVAGQKAQITTDANGQFSLPANRSAKKLRIRVSALGISSIFSFKAPFPESFLLRVAPKGFELETATIRTFSAREVVREAVKRIPQNYPTIGYFYYGFYRQYSRLDSAFLNLVEARVVTLINPEIGNKRLKAEYRFLPLAMRRQPYKYMPVEGVDVIDGIVDEVFSADPVYFLMGSSFGSAVFEESTYKFDTLSTNQENYVLDYQAKISSEDRGFLTKPGHFPGEMYEVGKLTIDRKSFAFVHIERKTFRNKWFKYEFPYQDNFVLPSRLHVAEFLGGQLDIWYKRQADRWILARVRHGFTNEFFRTGLLGYGRECAIGQFYEWKTDSVSHYIPKEIIPLFYENPFLHLVGLPKDTILPNTTPPFFFFPKQLVYEAAGWKED